MELVKCTNCKGTGLVPSNGLKKWEKCPICSGTGKKKIKKSNRIKED